MRKTVGVVTIAILITLLGLIFLSINQSSPRSASSSNTSTTETNQIYPTQTPVADIKASFAIFTNGTFRIFTSSMYHNLSQDAFIESSNPNLVHVKKTGVTWNNFFATLPFKLTSSCLTTGTKETFCSGNGRTLKFYINGVENYNALDQEIKNGDTLLVTYGSHSAKSINSQLQKVSKP